MSAHTVETLVRAGVGREVAERAAGEADAARRRRVLDHVRALRDKPPGMLPHNAAALADLVAHLEGLETLSADQAFEYDALVGSHAYAGFEPVDDGAFRLPEDAGPHRAQKTDRWSFRGWLHGDRPGRFFVSWDVWVRRAVPGGDGDELVRSCAALYFQNTGEVRVLRPATLSTDMPSVLVSGAPFALVAGRCHARSAHRARGYPMELRLDDGGDDGLMLRVDLVQTKHRYRQSTLRHGLGTRATGVPCAQAAGELTRGGAAHAVGGEMSMRHEWSHGTEALYYPRGMVRRSVDVVRGWGSAGPDRASGYAGTLFTDDGGQVVFSCANRHASAPYADHCGYSEADGSFVASPYAEVDVSGGLVRVADDALKLRLECEVVEWFYQPVSAYGPSRQRVFVCAVGGTISARPARGYGLVVADDDGTDAERVARSAALLGLHEAAGDGGKAPPGERFRSGEVSQAQNLRAVLFLALPLVLLIVVLSTAVYLYRLRMLPSPAAPSGA